MSYYAETESYFFLTYLLMTELNCRNIATTYKEKKLKQTTYLKKKRGKSGLCKETTKIPKA
jgi:hypothetical protein